MSRAPAVEPASEVVDDEAGELAVGTMPPWTEGELPEPPVLTRGLLGVPRYLGRVLRGFPSTLSNLEDTPIIGDVPGAKTRGRTRLRWR